MPVVELPTYRGGACQNERCDGAGPVRILSVSEVERMYPVKEGYDWWPLPPQATHVCTVCGFVYAGVSEAFAARGQETTVESFPIDEWEWEQDAQFDGTVRDATEAFIRGAPQRADTEMIARGVARYVAGADAEFGRTVMSAMDDYTGVGRSAAEFMRL